MAYNSNNPFIRTQTTPDVVRKPGQTPYQIAIAKQRAAQASARPGVYMPEQTQKEFAAGAMPGQFEGTRGAGGELLSQYKFDPYAGEANQALKQQAFAQGQSPWAAMQNQMLQKQLQDVRGQSMQQQGQAQSQAQSQLARFGGMGGGARTSLARSGARDALMGQQQLSREALGQRLGIGAQDIARKEDLLKGFQGAENQAQNMNINQMTGDITRRGVFDINRYNQQMAAYGAEKTAEAQRAAAGGGKK